MDATTEQPKTKRKGNAHILRRYDHASVRIDKVIVAQKKRLTGGSGIGRSTRGRPDHSRSKQWVLLSPEGEKISVANLSEWSRVNEVALSRSLPPEAIGSGKRQLWERIRDGISRASCKEDGEWYGWSVAYKASQNPQGEIKVEVS